MPNRIQSCLPEIHSEFESGILIKMSPLSSEIRFITDKKRREHVLLEQFLITYSRLKRTKFSDILERESPDFLVKGSRSNNKLGVEIMSLGIEHPTRASERRSGARPSSEDDDLFLIDIFIALQKGKKIEKLTPIKPNEAIQSAIIKKEGKRTKWDLTYKDNCILIMPWLYEEIPMDAIDYNAEKILVEKNGFKEIWIFGDYNVNDLYGGGRPPTLI